MAKEEDQNLPTSCTNYRLNSYDQLGRLCAYGIYKSSHKGNALALAAVDIGGKKMQGRTRLSLSCTHSGSRDQLSIEGEQPTEVK